MTIRHILGVFITVFAVVYLSYAVGHMNGKRAGYEERISEEVDTTVEETGEPGPALTPEPQ